MAEWSRAATPVISNITPLPTMIDIFAPLSAQALDYVAEYKYKG